MTRSEGDAMADGLLRVLRRIRAMQLGQESAPDGAGLEPSFLAGASYEEPRHA